MRQPTVMIVDDDAGLLAALKRRCDELGLIAITFTDLNRAVLEAKREVPDLIILDVLMPSGNGLDTCEELMQDERLMSTRIVMLTGESNADTRTRTQRAGAYYVRKGNHVWDRLKPILEQEFGAEASRTMIA